MHIPKWLIATAALLFVMLVAAIAFFIGRDSSRPPAAEVIATAPAPEPAAVNAPAPKEPAPPLAEAPTPTPAETRSVPAPIVTPPVSDAAPPPASPEVRVRVAAYFSQMDAIQAGGAIKGDSEEFANTIVSAALSGNFAGIDDLIRAAGEAERRAVAVQPPPECADYHRQALTLLQDSRAMAMKLRDGLKSNDANALTAIGESAQTMKSRADNLAASEKALRARFGL